MTDPKCAARDMLFLQRPFCWRENGSVVALGPRVVQEALSDRGLHFRFHELASPATAA